MRWNQVPTFREFLWRCPMLRHASASLVWEGTGVAKGLPACPITACPSPSPCNHNTSLPKTTQRLDREIICTNGRVVTYFLHL